MITPGCLIYFGSTMSGLFITKKGQHTNALLTMLALFGIVFPFFRPYSLLMYVLYSE
jgi:hypothetical protein